MPTIVVSDTNVFIALHKSGLLEKIFDSNRITVIIPEEIYKELTQNYRVTTEYPELANLISQLRHNTNHGYGISLQITDIQVSLSNTLAMEAFYDLKDDASLDMGELEAIPLAIEYSAVFLSCDVCALEEFGLLGATNGATAQHLIEYCESLVISGLISDQEFSTIKGIIYE